MVNVAKKLFAAIILVAFASPAVAQQFCNNPAAGRCDILNHSLIITNATDPRRLSATITDDCLTCDSRDVEFIVRKISNSVQIAAGVASVVLQSATWHTTINKSGLYKVEARQCWNYTPPIINDAAECGAQSAARCCSTWAYSTDASSIAPAGWLWLVEIPPASGGGLE